MKMDSVEQDEMVQLTAEIVSAYVSNNKVSPGDLGKLIEECTLPCSARRVDR
jgi:predicted transcriptional regulator